MERKPRQSAVFKPLVGEVNKYAVFQVAPVVDRQSTSFYAMRKAALGFHGEVQTLLVRIVKLPNARGTAFQDWNVYYRQGLVKPSIWDREGVRSTDDLFWKCLKACPGEGGRVAIRDKRCCGAIFLTSARTNPQPYPGTVRHRRGPQRRQSPRPVSTSRRGP